MNAIVKKLFGTLVTIGLLYVLIHASWYNYIFKGVYATYLQGHITANIFDGEYFDQGIIHAPPVGIPWPEAKSAEWAPPTEVQQTLDVYETGAFLVIHNDSIRHEDYGNGVTASTKTNSFSMAKSILTMMVEIAIESGDLPGWDALAIDYVKELHGPGASQLTLAHLTGMLADLDWDEDYYNPFGITAKALYGRDLRATVTGCAVGDQVGRHYEYQSGATALLGFCLEEATGMPLAEYASEKLWFPLGAEMDASWHLDDVGEALAFSGFNTTARDFARIGHLVLNQGNAFGEQLIDSSFFATATDPGLAQFYGYSFWLGDAPSPDPLSEATRPFVALRGHLGQWIITFPGLDLIIVRTGHAEGKEAGEALPASFMAVASSYAWKLPAAGH